MICTLKIEANCRVPGHINDDCSLNEAYKAHIEVGNDDKVNIQISLNMFIFDNTKDININKHKIKQLRKG